MNEDSMNVETQPFICPVCQKEPGSHSFVELESDRENNTRNFYTCPANATKYDDHDGILYHYDNTLAEIGDSPWIWIFDAKGFTMKHLLEIRVGIGLAKLITNKYSHNLKKIYIINPNSNVFIEYNIIKFFLPKKMQDLIQIDK